MDLMLIAKCGAGIIGFCGYEGLRVYKCVVEKRNFIPRHSWKLYLFSLTLVIPFTGFVAYIISNGNIGLGIFIGFSIPTNAKTILQKNSKSYFVDDTRFRATEKVQPKITLRDSLDIYFNW